MQNGKFHSQENVQDLIKAVDDKKLREELLAIDNVTLSIVFLKSFGYRTDEIGDLMGMKANTVAARMKRLRKKLKKFFI